MCSSCPLVCARVDRWIMIQVSTTTARVSMAKGRKFGSTHRDRLLGSQASIQDQPSAGGGDYSELAEEDVWSMIGDDHNSSRVPAPASHRYPIRGEPTRSNRRWTASVEDRRHAGGLSLAFEAAGKASSSRIIHQFCGSDRAMAAASSAPVNVPDWPKILRVDSVESLHDGYGYGGYGTMNEDEGEWVPPHEYLAQSRRSETHSVVEGVGRTLKGRDMSRVRNAVWSQTGFLG